MTPRRRIAIVALLVLIVLLLLLLLLLTRCNPAKSGGPQSAPAPAPSASKGAPAPTSPANDEVLTPATLAAPHSIAAGTAFSVSWTGPDNPGDFVTIVAPDSPASTAGNYRETKHGKNLELTAPMEAGPHEIRYVTVRSHTILARSPIQVEAVAAAVEAAPEVKLGAPFPVRWTGPNNKGDYVTIVPKDAPDDHYTSYAETEKGKDLTLTAPSESGEFELRYVSGQGRKVLARRFIKVLAPTVTLSGPTEATAGTSVEVAWTGPDNSGDYITVVPIEAPEGQYGNYTNTSDGSPLKLLLPIMSGAAELRYMTGQGGRILARRPLKIVAAPITLSAPGRAAPGADVAVTWTGPNNPGDYITIVTKATPDGQYAAYTLTTEGSPLTVKAPADAGEAEVRYMSGQGNNVLARIPLQVVP